jgi:SpoVK/Ycf46/Vps4 family AAA+-type ATPase
LPDYCLQRSSTDSTFQDIVGYDDVKRLFRMSLDSKELVSILLSGVPSSGKTMFLQALMKLDNSYFVDGRNSSKAGMVVILLVRIYLASIQLDRLWDFFYLV